MFSNLLPGNDSFAAVHCNGNVISGPLLNNGRLALAPLFRLSAVTSRYYKQYINEERNMFKCMGMKLHKGLNPLIWKIAENIPLIC
jgi:hypothetical protein